MIVGDGISTSFDTPRTITCKWSELLKRRDVSALVFVMYIYKVFHNATMPIHAIHPNHDFFSCASIVINPVSSPVYAVNEVEIMLFLHPSVRRSVHRIQNPWPETPICWQRKQSKQCRKIMLNQSNTEKKAVQIPEAIATHSEGA
jgi:hypothetical protein